VIQMIYSVRYTRRILFCICAFFLCANSGCRSAGSIIGILSSPNRSEKKIPAEYDLKGNKTVKILVLVDQPGWLETSENLRPYITDAVNKIFAEKLKIPHKNLVGYERISEFRKDSRKFLALTPSEVGASLETDITLLIMLEQYSLDELWRSGYYKGFLRAQAALFDSVTAKKLWPGSQQRKTISVGFELEQRSREAAVKRLSNGLAYCTTRYFYDCPVNKFKIADDRSGSAWKDWGKQ